MNSKQNLLETIHWGNPEYMPTYLDSEALVGTPAKELFVHPYTESRKDCFGVDWLIETAGPIPDPTKVMFDDVEDWEEYVKFPDLNAVDIRPMAEAELSRINRDEKLITYYAATGIFERLQAFMGFENLLVGLAASPDDCKDFFDAMADYQIALYKKIRDAYNIEMYVNFDDIATARGLFMSPQMYREIIWPYQKRIADAVREDDIIFAMHTCGLCEDVLDDYVEMGVQMWSSAQPMNDIANLLEKYRGKLVIEGGWDSNGAVCLDTATEEDWREETRRCAREYGVHGGYVFFPFIITSKGNAFAMRDPRCPAIMDEYQKVKHCLDTTIVSRCA